MLFWVGLAVYAYLSRIPIHNHGKLVAINVTAWYDENCTIPCTEIDWGTVYPGDTFSKEIYLKTLGNANATLHSYAINWSPSGIDQYLNYSWDSENKTILPNQPIKVTLYLTVSSDIPYTYSEFSFDIIVEATTTQ